MDEDFCQQISPSDEFSMKPLDIEEYWEEQAYKCTPHCAASQHVQVEQVGYNLWSTWPMKHSRLITRWGNETLPYSGLETAAL